MRILQLCHKPPLPVVDGGCIAINSITQGLIDSEHSVKVLTMSTDKHPFDLKHYSTDYLQETGIEGIYIDTNLNIIDAFSSLITRDSYNVSRFFSPDFDKKLESIIRRKKFDVVHLESIFTTPYLHTLRKFSRAKLVLRSHNLEFKIWEELASHTKNMAKKSYLKLLSNQLKNYELSIFNQLDGIVSISDQDKEKYKALGYEGPLKTIPLGIRSSDYQRPSQAPETPRFFYLGALDWQPNIEAVSWLITEIWPEIEALYPDVQLDVAGRNIPDWLINSGTKNVNFYSNIEDAKAFIHEHSIMLVPLFSGSGIRIKIIEGMVMGKTIITTDKGIEGIKATDGKEVLIANSATEFIQQISSIMEGQTQWQEMGSAARDFARGNFSITRLTEELITFYQGLLEE